MKKITTVVEIVGLAGAGKSSLVLALGQRVKNAQIGFRIRKIEYIPLYVHSFFTLLPVFYYRYRKLRWFSLKEAKAFIYLSVLHSAISQEAKKNQVMIILDQGPVFILTQIFSVTKIRKQINYHNYYGADKTEHYFEEWLMSIIKQWADTLDDLIWLDAPDSILLERINNRQKHHIIKTLSDSGSRDFLMHFRTCYEQILTSLDKCSRVLYFDTSRKGMGEIVDRVLFELEVKKSRQH